MSVESADPEGASIGDGATPLVRSGGEELRRIADELARVGAWSLDLANAVSLADARVFWSDEACAMHGLPAGHQPSLEEAGSFFGAEGRERWFAALEACRRSGTPCELELELTSAGGRRRWVRAIARRIDAALIVGAYQDVTERKRFEIDVRRSNRALAMLGRCNELLIRASDEIGFLADICRLVVEEGDYALAWAGFAGRDRGKRVVPVAYAGDNTGYLDAIDVSWSEQDPAGRGGVGQALRSGQLTVIADLASDPAFAPWRTEALRRGYRSAVVLPLGVDGATVGVLALYRCEAGVPSAGELDLLQNFADDVGFGIGHLRTLAERRRAEARLADQASWLDQARDAIVVRDGDGRITFWNMSAERLYGWSARETLGATLEDLRLVDDSPVRREAVDAVFACGFWNGELEHRRKDGTLVTVESRWTLMRDAAGRPRSVLTIDTDITERKAAEREIERLAFYDPLTGLPNRALFLQRLESMVAEDGRFGAILFLDLDHFKSLNDTFGHDRGDALLREVAARVRAAVDPADTVARLGGDEFVVLLECCEGSADESAEAARRVAEAILARFEAPFVIDGYEHVSTPSIGVAVFAAGERSGEVLKRADVAMYQAKASGRNTVRLYDPRVQAAAEARRALEDELRVALRTEEFALVYQPQVNLGGRTIGAEALLRWRREGCRPVSPAEFIPIAEECGLIAPLGAWVLETACRQLGAWSDGCGGGDLRLSVNISAYEFRQPGFVERALAIVAATGVDARRLLLELTESAFVDNVELVVASMSALKRAGFGFSLDDFGTGYSSLSYIKRLPFDQLKIDHSFVRDVLTDENDAAIVRTIVGLGRTLGLEVIAEGVETRAQYDFLRAIGCRGFQGFYFGKPVPGEILGARLDAADASRAQAR
jgi:diguanylate cyclase (GGDEF)-like protein/PAS domain S-box-containing protein